MIFINSHRIKHWLSADPVKGNRNVGGIVGKTFWEEDIRFSFSELLAGDVEVFQYRNIVDRNVEYSLGNRYL